MGAAEIFEMLPAGLFGDRMRRFWIGRAPSRRGKAHRILPGFHGKDAGMAPIEAFVPYMFPSPELFVKSFSENLYCIDSEI
jgi:hypothetical protein